MKNRRQSGFTLTEMMLVIVVILGMIGWGMNIYFLVDAAMAEQWVPAVIRGIGIIVAPAGAVMGYIPFG